MASAISSLPTPLSPVMSTDARVGATCDTTSKTRLIWALLPMMLENRLRFSSSSWSSLCLSTSSRLARARLTMSDMWSRFGGFARKS